MATPSMAAGEENRQWSAENKLKIRYLSISILQFQNLI
jgi:hypothetical protein